MPDIIRNSKKPLTGLIAGAIGWLALKVGLDVDPTVATAIAAGVFAVAVRVVGPVFGIDLRTPEVSKDSRGYLEVKTPVRRGKRRR